MVELSVIIPTHNRASILTATLNALRSQMLPTARFEVIVVADGCTDETLKMASAYEAPFHLLLVDKRPAGGPGAAINMGVARASGHIVMFLDDDMEASPQLLSEHLSAHQREPGGVVLGFFPMQPEQEGDDNFTIAARSWWAKRFSDYDKADYRYTFQDFCGNVSLPISIFRNLGGFDEEFDWRAAGEDYELGYRLIARGVLFRFVRRAATTHHTRTPLDISLRRAEQEGYGHSLMVRKHPELFSAFDLSRLHRLDESWPMRLVSRAAWASPALAAVVAASVKAIVAARSRKDVASSKLYQLLRGYYYWRGVRNHFGSKQVWEAFVREVSARRLILHEIDLEVPKDLHRLEERVDRNRVDALRIWSHGVIIGRIPPVPGGESIRAAHVRELLGHPGMLHT